MPILPRAKVDQGSPLGVVLRRGDKVDAQAHPVLEVLGPLGLSLPLLAAGAKRPPQLLVLRVRVVPELGLGVEQPVDPLGGRLQPLPVLDGLFQARKGVLAQGLALLVGHDGQGLVAFARALVLACVSLRGPLHDDVGGVLGVGPHLDGPAARGVAEAEAPYGRGVVGACFFLFGVEAHALGDDGRFGARGAPDGEGHFEAHGEDAVGGEFGCALAEAVFLMDFVGRGCAFEVRRDVASHVEALHGGQIW